LVSDHALGFGDFDIRVVGDTGIVRDIERQRLGRLVTVGRACAGRVRSR
jgi:hypothetical protein